MSLLSRNITKVGAVGVSILRGDPVEESGCEK